MGRKLEKAKDEVRAKIRRWELRKLSDEEFMRAFSVQEVDTVIAVLNEVLEMMECVDET